MLGESNHTHRHRHEIYLVCYLLFYIPFSQRDFLQPGKPKVILINDITDLLDNDQFFFLTTNKTISYNLNLFLKSALLELCIILPNALAHKICLQ